MITLLQYVLYRNCARQYKEYTDYGVDPDATPQEHVRRGVHAILNGTTPAVELTKDQWQWAKLIADWTLRQADELLACGREYTDPARYVIDGVELNPKLAMPPVSVVLRFAEHRLPTALAARNPLVVYTAAVTNVSTVEIRTVLPDRSIIRQSVTVLPETVRNFRTDVVEVAQAIEGRQFLRTALDARHCTVQECAAYSRCRGAQQMEKYNVDTSDDNLPKQASVVACPTCQRPLLDNRDPVRRCPVCGTEPFETPTKLPDTQDR